MKGQLISFAVATSSLLSHRSDHALFKVVLSLKTEPHWILACCAGTQERCPTTIKPLGHSNCFTRDPIARTRITAIGHRLTAFGRAKEGDDGNRVVNCGDVRSPYNLARFARPIE